MVVISHASMGLYFRSGWIPKVGIHGVEIFFVLSGYLITSRLLTNGNLKDFYIRRFFRLMPCVWTYLAVVSGLGWMLHLNIIGIDALSSILFFRNFYPSFNGQSTLTSHFWSLSIEEQFYLFWPLVLAVTRRPVLFLCAATGALSVLRWQSPMPAEHVAYAALCLGCLLAFAVREEWFCMMIRKHHVWVFPLSAAAFIWTLLGPPVASEPFLIAFLLASTNLNPSSIPSRILEQRHLKQIGVWSYSIYVWQQLLLMTHTGWIGSMLLPLAAIGSYTYIERPCIRFGAKLAQKGSSRILGDPNRETSDSHITELLSVSSQPGHY